MWIKLVLKTATKCTIKEKKQQTTDCDLFLPVSSRVLSGLRLSTELRFDGIGKLGFGRFFNAASACCTASCRTSKLKKPSNENNMH